MANRIGRISMIKKEYQPGVTSATNSLRMHGYQKMPGTGKLVFPHKENNGTYRTGLDENASYLERIEDKTIRDSEKARIKELRLRLEKELGISLAPDSPYYKWNGNAVEKDGTSILRVEPFKLTDKDAVFDLSIAIQAVTYAWLSVLPSIAPSMEAYNSGKVVSETQYFVNDTDTEVRVLYDRKKILNDAIVKLNSLSLERRKKIARLMDLPFSDDSAEDAVYNGIDDLLKLNELPTGAYKGKLPVSIFNMFVELNAEALDVRDLVEQAFRSNVYRTKKGGKVFEGEYLAWESKEDLIDHLLDDKNQADRLELEKKLKINKLKV